MAINEGVKVVQYLCNSATEFGIVCQTLYSYQKLLTFHFFVRKHVFNTLFIYLYIIMITVILHFEVMIKHWLRQLNHFIISQMEAERVVVTLSIQDCVCPFGFFSLITCLRIAICWQ